MNSLDKGKRVARLATSVLALVAWLALVSCPNGSAFPQREAGTPSAAPLAPQFAVADFDGDHVPDLANVRSAAGDNRSVTYLIDFGLSTGLRRTFGVKAAAGGLQLAPRDVNGDHFPDLVVTSLLTGEPIVVLLNDGRGNFSKREPSAFPEAFHKSDESLAAESNGSIDRPGALFSRTTPEDSDDFGWLRSYGNAERSLTTKHFSVLPSSGREPRRGRAPPISS